MHISHKITPLNKQTKISLQRNTNSEGHIAANEYSVEKEKK
jgi:hypothetical protein